MEGKACSSPPSAFAAKRRVMVVADPTTESMGALQYVLSHAMHDYDELILMHVMNPKRSMSIKSLLFRRHSDPGVGMITNFEPTSTANEGILRRGGGRSDSGGGDFLEAMRTACRGMYPNSRVWIERVQQQRNFDNNNNNNNNNNSKGAIILLKCKELSVDLLVIGQRRHLVSVLLGPRRSISGTTRVIPKSEDLIEYLIENSPCTCVAVQKKGQNSGYILNSKTHRNFWLLV